MTRLNRFPGEYHRPPKEQVELLPAFDDTITASTDETMRNLKIFRERSVTSEEEKRWQLQAFEDLRREIAELRKVVTEQQALIGRKASLKSQGEFEKALTDAIAKRVDTIRSTAMWAVGILFVVVVALTKVGK